MIIQRNKKDSLGSDSLWSQQAQVYFQPFELQIGSLRQQWRCALPVPVYYQAIYRGVGVHK